MKKKRIFIGLNDIANIPMMHKKSFEEAGFKCDYYLWSDIGNHPFGYQKDKVFFQFKQPPPFRIFGMNPFWLINKILAIIYLFFTILRYEYFLFISPNTFLKDNRDLKIIKFFGRKIIMNFTGCAERDINLTEADDDFICKRCQDTRLQKWCSCVDPVKKKARVNRMESYSYKILGQDDITGYVNDKSKLLWLYIACEQPGFKINISEKFNREEIRIIHFPSNPLVKQSHIIKPVLDKFNNYKNIKIIIKEGIWERERIQEELSKAHILVNVLGTGYNVLAVEAMSNGCVVFNSHPYWFKRNVPDAPIVPITAENLEETLKHFINNKSELMEYAQRSVDYYTRYHSIKAVGNYYKQMFEN